MKARNVTTIAVMILAAELLVVSACSPESGAPEIETVQKYDVIFDTDANNEIDDQHALAYLLFSGDYFNVEGITVNATSAPGRGMPRDIQAHYDEARRVKQAQILHRMPGVGPRIAEPITGRHGGEFDNWGDYSVNLFEMYRMSGDPPSRPLFDMAAVAILKNPLWAESSSIPAPIMDIEEDIWIDRPDNPREIILWEWFDIYGIMNDFFQTMENPVLVSAADERRN